MSFAEIEGGEIATAWLVCHHRVLWFNKNRCNHPVLQQELTVTETSRGRRYLSSIAGQDTISEQVQQFISTLADSLFAPRRAVESSSGSGERLRPSISFGKVTL
jgi:hypothetical protein